MSGMGVRVAEGGAWAAAAAAARVRRPTTVTPTVRVEGRPARRFKATDGARERAKRRQAEDSMVYEDQRGGGVDGSL